MPEAAAVAGFSAIPVALAAPAPEAAAVLASVAAPTPLAEPVPAPAAVPAPIVMAVPTAAAAPTPLADAYTIRRRDCRYYFARDRNNGYSDGGYAAVR